MTFKEKLVKLRKLRSITQDELASAVGVSRQAVYKWESGQSYPAVPKLLEIKKLFGISIDDLLDDNYEVVLPEKKKKRLPRAERARIEREVRRDEGIEDEPVEVEVAPVIEEPIEEVVPEVVDEVVPEVVEPVVEEAPVEEAPAIEAPVEVVEAVEEEPVAEETPVVEEEPVLEAPVEETTVVDKTPVIEETVTEPKVEEAVEEEPKKKGFFARIFGW